MRAGHASLPIEKLTFRSVRLTRPHHAIHPVRDEGGARQPASLLALSFALYEDFFADLVDVLSTRSQRAGQDGPGKVPKGYLAVVYVGPHDYDKIPTIIEIWLIPIYSTQVDLVTLYVCPWRPRLKSNDSTMWLIIMAKLMNSRLPTYLYFK